MTAHTTSISNSKSPRPAKFFGLAAVVVILSSLCLALLMPVAAAHRLKLADEFATSASNMTGSQAVANFQLAAWLNPDNHRVRLNLARTRLAADQPEAALAQLNRAGKGIEVARLKLRTLIELGSFAQAQPIVVGILGSTSVSSEDIELSCLAFILNGNKAGCEPLKARVTTPAALGRIERAQAGEVMLAVELASHGLPEAARGVLKSAPQGLSRNIALGELEYQAHTPESLNRSKILLEQAVLIDASSIAARQALIATLRDLGLTEAAEAQDMLKTKLISGRP